MSVIENYPNMRPSLVLDFASVGRVDPRIQCTRGSTATVWGPDRKLRSVAANVPRIGFDPSSGQCLGLLVEGARTNLVSWSGDFTNAVWGKGNTTTGAAHPRTYGLLSGIKLVENTQSGVTHALTRNVPVSLGTTVLTQTWIVAAAERKAVSLRCAGNAYVARATFDLVSGIAAKPPEGVTSRMRRLADDLWELVATWQVPADTNQASCWIELMDNLPTAGGTITYAGDGVSGIYVFAAQLEIGDAATSYIPTTSAAATRAFESMVLPAAVCAELMNQDLTLVQQLTTQSPIPGAGSLRHLGASVYANGNNRARLYANSANGGRVAFSGRLNGATDTFAVSCLSNLAAVVPPVRAAFTLTPSGPARASVNGGAVSQSDVQTGSLSGLPPVIYFGSLSGEANAAEQSQDGYIQRVAIYPGAASDTQLRRLSA